MSKIKNGGLDQYGVGPFERQKFGTASVEGVKTCQINRPFELNITSVLISMSELYSGGSLKSFEMDDVDDFAQVTLDVNNHQLIVGARYVLRLSFTTYALIFCMQVN